jgi:hypothetical protein
MAASTEIQMQEVDRAALEARLDLILKEQERRVSEEHSSSKTLA